MCERTVRAVTVNSMSHVSHYWRRVFRGMGESKNELCSELEQEVLACVPGFQEIYINIEIDMGTSEVISGQDTKLPMQGAQVRSLVKELDPTCHN